ETVTDQRRRAGGRPRARLRPADPRRPAGREQAVARARGPGMGEKGCLLARGLGVLLITLSFGAAALADEARELAKKKQNPIPDLSSVSFDNGTNFGRSPH